MKLRRNPEAARLFVSLCAVFLFFLVLAFMAFRIGMHSFQEAIVSNHAAVIGAVTDQFPEAEKAVIDQIRAADSAAYAHGLAVLAKYGLDTKAVLSDTERIQQSYRMNAFLIFSLVIVLFFSLFILFYVFLRFHYRTIREVSRYARAIAEGNDSLDIRDNDEGDISMMKNDIYKITTMLKEQTNRLKREKGSLSDSIADISHQLKTPLTSLFVLTDLLDSEPSKTMQKQFLARIQSQLQRMEWLITTLLKLSKLDAGTVEMKRERFKVKDLIDKSLKTLSTPLEIKMHEVDIRGDDCIELTGDFNWTMEAVVNILKNAIEHAPEHGRIQISFAENPLYVSITVKDNGTGIAPEDLPYIFNRFYKGKNAGDDSVGIGLAMAYAVVAAQGGDITVRSGEDGTEFTIAFFKRHDQ